MNLHGDPVGPDDIVAAAEHVAATLAPAVGADWTVSANAVDWDVRSTVLHAVSCVTCYTVDLANQSTARTPLAVTVSEHATNEQVLGALGASARLMALVATASPASARGFHEGGMADTSGFVAMAIDEVIVHGADAAAGLGLAYEPPERLARKVVDRLFPWAPADTDGWTALLWANGRLPLPGQPEIRPNWSWQCAPLDEWEGDIRFHRRQMPAAFEWDTDARCWRAVLSRDGLRRRRSADRFALLVRHEVLARLGVEVVHARRMSSQNSTSSPSEISDAGSIRAIVSSSCSCADAGLA